MSEYIDVMSFLPAHSPYFTVNTGVLAVDIRRPTGLGYDFHLRSSGGFKNFQAGDNFVVVSAGFVLPESFALAQGPANLVQNNPSITIGAQVLAGGAIYYLQNFSTTGIMMPIENYELPANIFVDIVSVNNGATPPVYPFRLAGFNLIGLFTGLDETNSIYPQVSMVGVPASLNATRQHLTMFIKVVHNFPLV